jgi:formylglycine-generating enzyme required for sulfatase activity/class 3 adenylate cyclase
MPGEVRQFGGDDKGFFPPGGPPRRLAAILAGDIAGYSRLMGIDEEGTHARVTRQRRELIDPAIAEHHGKVVKNTGDGFIAMFDSPVEAVRCAIVIQQSMIGRNAALARSQQILYRIGVNLGDVIVEPDDIFGEGVNIAARLETLAEPGSVYISGGVYEQIKNKLVCGYQSLGDQKVKNITDPVSVYRVLPDPAAVRQARPVGTVVAMLALVAVIVGASVGAGWFLRTREDQQMAGIPLPASPAPRTAPIATALSPPQTAASPPPASAALATPPAPTVPPAAAAGSSEPEVARAAPEAIKEPEMVALLGAEFAMGSNEDPSEKPIHIVKIPPFEMAKFPVSVGEWKACVAAKACTAPPVGDDEAPMTNLSWSDTQQFVIWLSHVTQKNYRLPTEAEWEYAARGGTETRYWWGTLLRPNMVNCRGCNEPYDPKAPLNVGTLKSNPFGLYDMGGGVDQWVADCWHRTYQGARSDGLPWIGGDCFTHVLRGGSWKSDPSYVRPASRNQYDTSVRYPTHGFRIARSP